jgi:uncharacterized protein
MDKVIIASLQASAGKTSVIAGLARVCGSKIGYLKPFGDRLIYVKKRLWDYDSSVLAKFFQLDQEPEQMSLGYHHSKLRYAYDETSARNKLQAMASVAATGAKIVFVETGPDLAYGSSVHLDPVSLSDSLKAPLVIVISGDEDRVRDDVVFLRRYLKEGNVACAGIIINKVRHKEDFNAAHIESIKKTGFNVLGVIPLNNELNTYTLASFRETLLARVVTGDNLLNRAVRNVFFGTASVQAAMKSVEFNQPDLLVVTSGDRSDLILAAMERKAAGIILTDGTLPPANIIGLATDNNLPILVVSSDTYQTAKTIDAMEPLLHLEDPKKLDLLEKMVRENVNTGAIL